MSRARLIPGSSPNLRCCAKMKRFVCSPGRVGSLDIFCSCVWGCVLSSVTSWSKEINPENVFVFCFYFNKNSMLCSSLLRAVVMWTLPTVLHQKPAVCSRSTHLPLLSELSLLLFSTAAKLLSAEDCCTAFLYLYLLVR